ncbi:MAG: PAS domain S-box protein [Candidatus Rokubacteria bacterium]|nr:PAS domain S-box protein [Candidatus Rokubacteria bacterium]
MYDPSGAGFHRWTARFRDLGARLLCLVLVATVPLLALTVYARFGDRRIAIEHATTEALNVARLTAREQAQVFEGARQLLIGLAQVPAVRTLDAAPATGLFRVVVERFPSYPNLGAATPAGDVFAAAKLAPGGVSIADRDYFQRALRTRDFAYSGYLIGRTTGKPSLVLAYPAVDEGGAVRAVVWVALDLAWVAQVGVRAQLPAASVISLIDGSGVLLARHPEAPGVGRGATNAEIVKAILSKRGEGTARGRGIDGVRRLYAFSPLPIEREAGEAYVVVGIPEAEAFAEANWRMGVAFSALVFSLVLALGGAWLTSERLVLRPVAALRAAAERLAAGDLRARTSGPRQQGELGRLTDAFDSMAAALAKRQQDLVEAEAKYRALVEQSLTGVYLVRGERILYVNDAFARMLGYRPDEIVGRLGAMELAHPDDRARVAGNIRARMEGELDALHYALRCVRKDGSAIDCEVFGRRITDEDGPAILGTMIDVTERKRAEAELRRLNRALETVGRCNMALVRSQDEPSLFGEVCRVIVETGGYPMAWVGLAEGDEARRITPVARVGEDARHLDTMRRIWADFTEEASPVSLAIRTGRPAVVSVASAGPGLAAWRAEAARVGHACQIALPLSVEGQTLGVLGICAREPDALDQHEVTLLSQLADDVAYGMAALRGRVERQRLEEERERERQAMFHREKLAEMGSLLAGVAHELNNPLSVVIGRLNLLQATMAGGPAAEGLAKAAAASDRCVRIVRNFLALARQRPPERQRTSLNEVVKEAVELVAYPLRVNSVEVSLALADDLPALWADAHQLHQVVVNLITNANQAMQERAGPRRLTLTTRAEADGRRVVLEVADTGPGIPPEIRTRLFEPFFTTKPVGQGTGLGLAMCQGIVEGHGGAIRAGSEPGQGATFVVELPVELPAVQESEAVSEAVLPPRRGARILVVDDEPEIGRVLEEILATDGHRVDTAANGAEARARLREAAYDAVLCDIRMPVLDGPGLYRALEREHPALTRRIAFMTGDSLSPQTRAFLDRSGVPTVEKPFDAAAVKRVIALILSAARPPGP